jgi:hypothetical protein
MTPKFRVSETPPKWVALGRRARGEGFGRPLVWYSVNEDESRLLSVCTEPNNEGGVWDGGDCCKETCDSEFSYYECGREMQPFDCKDPDIIYMADYVP